MGLMSLQEGAYVINISREVLSMKKALLRCIKEKSLRAGLDVFVGEPNSKEAHFEHALLSHPMSMVHTISVLPQHKHLKW